VHSSYPFLIHWTASFFKKIICSGDSVFHTPTSIRYFVRSVLFNLVYSLILLFCKIIRKSTKLEWMVFSYISGLTANLFWNVLIVAVLPLLSEVHVFGFLTFPSSLLGEGEALCPIKGTQL
jgi:hypothetical protein